ncbi:hypothetical protein BGX34_006499, partial [Mortierella sp. NVP85]
KRKKVAPWKKRTKANKRPMSRARNRTRNNSSRHPRMLTLAGPCPTIHHPLQPL